MVRGVVWWVGLLWLLWLLGSWRYRIVDFAPWRTTSLLCSTVSASRWIISGVFTCVERERGGCSHLVSG